MSLFSHLRFGGRRDSRPAGLWHLMYGLFVAWVGLGPVFLVVAALDVGLYTWGGRRLSGPAYLLGAPGAITLAIAFACFLMWFGLYRERPWVRHVIAGGITGAMALAILAAATHRPIASADLLPPVGVVLALCWYLYRKHSVRQYFAELASRQAGA